ncbi:hypothetical protein S7711_03483 [Stachybotrys chartarum IBT 7711]|uniref:Fringe-like glycosyltransferase domain-containing protein n=1 Tax=Stachybotrys chartarum (strain CBS 109288 / IBT 7711) TaxID=1280523 RepID=A0A084AFW4_STACB|nr:hypothetical protein S7711_03483 [Stachybotrys chartarum IBT 7711]
MDAHFRYQQVGPKRNHPRATLQLGRLPINIDVRSKLRSLIQRAGGIPSPLMRVLRIAALVLIFLLLYLNLPSMRPYTTDLVLKTSDLRDVAAAAKSMILGDNDALPANDSARGAHPTPKHVINCNPDIGALREIRDRYELGDEIEYLKRYVRFSREPIERQSYTVLQQSFLPDGEGDKSFRMLRLSRSQHDEEECHNPLEVTVPQSRFPADVDLSDFMFAISTTFKRLASPRTIQEWSFWLTDGNGRSNGGKLLLRLLDASEPDLLDVAQRLADAGIDAEVSAWDSRIEKEMAVRYLNLVPLLISHESSYAKKWFVLCDDDTFFTAMNKVIARFKRYDHTKPIYAGTLSEDMAAVKTHGSQAFGGAGVFLSRPMARIISSVHESCRTRAKIKQSNTGWGPQGDILLRMCIYDNTDIRLTHLRDLWQLDISGDASGFYESGLQPYSVHHFKSPRLWHSAYPLNTTKIAYTCGEDCPYQRFVTTDNFVISNGYSIAQYSNGIDFDLEQVERTFHALQHDKGWDFDYTYGPQRPSLLKTGKKIAWELRESQNMEDGSVSQVYIRKKDDKRWTTKEGRLMKVLDGVIELVWIPA